MRERLENGFHCPKCRGRGGQAREVTLPDRLVLPLHAGHYWAVSCRLCGFTELYRADAMAEAARITEADGRGAPCETP